MRVDGECLMTTFKLFAVISSTSYVYLQNLNVILQSQTHSPSGNWWAENCSGTKLSSKLIICLNLFSFIFLDYKPAKNLTHQLASKTCWTRQDNWAILCPNSTSRQSWGMSKQRPRIKQKGNPEIGGRVTQHRLEHRQLKQRKTLERMAVAHYNLAKNWIQRPV